MEQMFRFGDTLVLLTTGANKHECQAWSLWEKADVVISITHDGVKVLKGQEILDTEAVSAQQVER